MATKPLPSQEVLRQLLRYDPETGKLFWLHRDVSLFEDGEWNPAHRKAASWNAKNAEKEALTCRRPEGYFHGAIYGKIYVAHRVIWKIVYGDDPEFVDHINGNTSDNRIANLRSVSKRENSLNQKWSGRGSSGVLGVNWHRRLGKWHAKIGVNGKTCHLGYYSNIEDATAARRAADHLYGFHSNHGR